MAHLVLQFHWYGYERCKNREDSRLPSLHTDARGRRKAGANFYTDCYVGYMLPAHDTFYGTALAMRKMANVLALNETTQEKLSAT